MNQPIKNRRVKWVGRDKSGKDKWIIVTSNAAYINHSCNPNAKVNENFEVVALRTIKKDEEITISYNSRSLNNFLKDMKWEKEWDFICLCESHNCQKQTDKFMPKIRACINRVINI